MRIDQWLGQTTELLQASDSAKLDAELLLLQQLNKPRSFLFTWPDHLLTAAQLAALASAVARRQAGEPIAHILGQREFWSLPLQCNASTLIPRPDTESLVECALALPLPDKAQVVDLGTGTGAIALALKSERPHWQVQGVEFSLAAAQLARTNAAALGLDVAILVGSWFAPLMGQRFDLIVSNPPYIDPSDHHLEEGDVRFEPRTALVAAEQGLADLRQLIEQAPNYLNNGGYLLLEHGYDQGLAVANLFTLNGFEHVVTGRDYGQRDRYTLGRWQH